MATFADRLKSCRQSKRLTLRELAKLATVDAGWISRLESGERQNISLLAAVRLANALHVSLDYLSGRDRRHWDGLNKP